MSYFPTAVTTPAEMLDLVSVRHQVEQTLTQFLDAKQRAAVAMRHPADVTETMREFLDAGGKRIRPLLCVVGWHAAGGCGDRAVIVRVAAALELFVAFALIHDDIMDDSATRRGRPTVQRAYTARWNHRPDAGLLGTSTALLIGDFALIWCGELMHTAGLPEPRQRAVHALCDAMLEEVMFGQFRDLLGGTSLSDDVEAAVQIARYKTATGTFVRPLQIGGAVAGTDTRLLDWFADVGMPLGEAFQLRDDLLGVFGAPEATGKPNLDDLREGKHTALLALALREATDSQRRDLSCLVGQPDLDQDGADHVRAILTATGARDEVERMITNRVEMASRLLEAAPVSPAAAAALRYLALAGTARTA